MTNGFSGRSPDKFPNINELVKISILDGEVKRIFTTQSTFAVSPVYSQDFSGIARNPVVVVQLQANQSDHILFAAQNRPGGPLFFRNFLFVEVARYFFATRTATGMKFLAGKKRSEQQRKRYPAQVNMEFSLLFFFCLR